MAEKAEKDTLNFAERLRRIEETLNLHNEIDVVARVKKTRSGTWRIRHYAGRSGVREVTRQRKPSDIDANSVIENDIMETRQLSPEMFGRIAERLEDYKTVMGDKKKAKRDRLLIMAYITVVVTVAIILLLSSRVVEIVAGDELMPISEAIGRFPDISNLVLLMLPLGVIIAQNAYRMVADIKRDQKEASRNYEVIKRANDEFFVKYADEIATVSDS